MRIVFIGCVDFSQHCLQELIKRNENVVGIFSKKISTYHSDFKDLWPIAKKNGIPIFDVEDINDVAVENKMRGLKPDVIFCFGWSQILKKNILSIAPWGVIGTHPALLPKNRGNHPIIWALVLGLTESGLTFFKMNDRVDGGDIISQEKFKISPSDNAADVYAKVKLSASGQLRKLLPLLKSNQLKIRKQNLSEGNYWRKRSISDGRIDWRMSSEAICNLVRALSHPYVGAHCEMKGVLIKVWKVSKITCGKRNIEPGRVLKVSGKVIIVKTFDAAIKLENHEFVEMPKVGGYLSC